jgi:hypothetical protein
MKLLLKTFPRLFTGFAKNAAELPHYDKTENNFRVFNLQFPQLSLSDKLKLLAISYTNTPVQKVLDIPFPNSRLAGELTWSQPISNGV